VKVIARVAAFAAASADVGAAGGGEARRIETNAPIANAATTRAMTAALRATGHLDKLLSFAPRVGDASLIGELLIG
jgi:hypothetical protein